jgi:tRNA(Ile)-lysidine synthase
MREQTTLFNCQVIRPLLSTSREQLLQYALAEGLTWIEDESNTDISLKRNFLRHEIIPRLKQHWPKAVEKLAMTAEHCQQASDNLYELAEMDGFMPTLRMTRCFDDSYTEARHTNLLRAWFKSLGLRPPTQAVMKEILALCEAKVDAMPKVKVGAYYVHRYQGVLYLEPALPSQLAPIAWNNYPSPLVIDALQMTIEGIYDVPIGAKVSIRFREGGETIRLNGQEKSLKTLMQAWKIPPWRRHLVPLFYVDDRLVGVVGYTNPLSSLYSLLPESVPKDASGTF